MLALTVLAFFAHQTLNVEPATIALAGAAVYLLVSRLPLEQVLSKIEWPTLFFFVALFVMVGALEVTGEPGHRRGRELTGGDRTAELLGILWVSGSARQPSTTFPLPRR